MTDVSMWTLAILAGIVCIAGYLLIATMEYQLRLRAFNLFAQGVIERNPHSICEIKGNLLWGPFEAVMY